MGILQYRFRICWRRPESRSSTYTDVTEFRSHSSDTETDFTVVPPDLCTDTCTDVDCTVVLPDLCTDTGTVVRTHSHQ